MFSVAFSACFASLQSHQSVLKGIGIINQKFISKIDFFYKLRAVPKHCPQTIHLKISVIELSHKLFYKLLNLVCGFLNGNFI